MDPGHELKTVTADQAGARARKYDSADSTSRLPALAAFGAHLAVAAVMIKKLFWQPAEAAVAPADQPSAALDADDASHVSTIAPDGPAGADDSSFDPDPDAAQAADGPGDGGPDIPAGRRKASGGLVALDGEAAHDLDPMPGTADETRPVLTGLRDPGTPSRAFGSGPFVDFDAVTPASGFAFSGAGAGGVRLPGNDNFAHDLVGATLPAASPGGEGGPPIGPGGEIIVPQKPIEPAAAEDDDLRRMNRAPVLASSVVLAALAMNQSVLIGLSDLLAHASDPDGDALDVTGLTASSGQLVDLGNGTWRFTPDLGDTSEVSFHYAVGDGQASVLQTASLDLLPDAAFANVIVGTPADDVIATRPGSVVVDALAGDDLVETGDGDDVIHGDDGDDIIFAGAGDDLVVAGRGNDIVFGGAGNDVILGGEGDDILFGEAGNDRIWGEAGNDIVDGGEGDDILAGGAGADVVMGGAGDDTLVAGIGDGDDVYDGGTGSDTYDASATTAGITVDLAAGRAMGPQTGSDTLANIENVVGGSGDDTIVADAAANVLQGGGGSDTFVFGAAVSTQGAVAVRDVIADFEPGDRIDVSRIDADEGSDGQQRFTLSIDTVGSGSGNGDHRGLLKFRFEQVGDGEHTLIRGFVDDDDLADLIIDLVGRFDLTEADFKLDWDA